MKNVRLPEDLQPTARAIGGEERKTVRTPMRSTENRAQPRRCRPEKGLYSYIPPKIHGDLCVGEVRIDFSRSSISRECLAR